MPDTAAPGFPGIAASAGQCAATALIVKELLGGDMVSARVEGLSHWFNRFRVNNAYVDADITGDQFGRPLIQIAAEGKLYQDTHLRAPGHLNEETLRRVRLLAERAGVEEVVASVDARLESQHQKIDQA